MKRWATILPLLLLLALLVWPPEAQGQGVTSATIRGTVLDENGEPLPGANVQAVHEPSGSRYGSSTGENGQFTVANVRVGGPYTITVSFVGYQSQRETNIQLDLGETRTFEFQLESRTQEMEEVQVVGERGAVFDESRKGLSTNISEEEVETAPTIDRSIADFARFTPQAIVGNDDDDGSSISIAGQNNRYNSIFIDGAVSNDVFGLSATGTDGGQTGATPISIDAIEQFNIEVSPYDVTQSYFGGGAINAVTRSGTNQFQGSFAFEYRDENLAEDLPDAPFPEFSNTRYVGRFGGPIIKDELFFFVNFDLNSEDSPQPFEGGFDEYRGTAIQSESDLNDFLSFLDQTVGDRYDPGNFRGQATTLDSDKFFGKLDWNISQNHRLSARYNYSDSRNVDAFGGNPTGISFSSTNEVFPNTTQNAALELNSTFGNKYANKLILSYKNVEDDRDTNLGQPFPTVDVGDGQGGINLGGEPFSTVNFLKQEVFTLTNDFDIFLGDHTLTVGTHNELYDLTNKFVPFNYGWYIFFDRPFGPEEFQNGTGVDEFKQTVCASLDNPGSVDDCSQYPSQPAPSVFARGFSLVDDNPSTSQFEEVIGDGTNAEGAFRALNTSLYVQDEWTVSERLTLTTGLRVDVPIYLDDPSYANPEEPLIPDDPQIDPRNTTIPAIEQFHSMNGARPGDTPDPVLHWAPRFGFNFDAFGDEQTQIRGGTGVFTSRQPFVWPGGMYLNNGTNTGTVDFQFGRNPFRANPENGLTVADVSDRDPSDLIPSGRLEMFEEEYYNPRFWRSSIGVDQELPGGFVGTFEAQYSNTLKNVLVTNVNLRPPNATLNGPDNRPIWVPSEYGPGTSPFTQAGDQRVDTRYSNIHRVGNTDRGYSYNITTRLRKTFENVLSDQSAIRTDFSYTFGRSFTVNDGTSSQINSLWDGVEHVNGANNIRLAESDFSPGHRVLARVGYQQQLGSQVAATLTLIYDGQSGRPFSYVIANSDVMVQERGESNSLFYVPQSASALNFAETNVQGVTVTPEQQAAALDQFISESEYLSQHRGEYTARNADRTPWEGVFDLNFRLEVLQDVLGRQQSVELTANIFNFSSMLGDVFGTDWGERFIGTNQVNLTQFQGFEDAENGDYTPRYTAQIVDVADTNGDGDPDEFRGALDQEEIFNERRTGSSYSSQWQMKFGVRYNF